MILESDSDGVLAVEPVTGRHGEDDDAPAAYRAAHPNGLGFTGAHLIAHWDTINDYAHVHPGSKPSGYDLAHAYPGYLGAHCHFHSKADRV